MTDPITTPEQMREAAIDAVHEADSLELATHGGNKIVDRIRAIPIAPQSDYRLAPHLQRIVEAAKTAPQWDTVNDRMAPQPVAVTVKPLPHGAEKLDAALAEYTPGIDRAVRFITIDQVDALAEFYLQNRNATHARDVRAAALREAGKALRDWQDDLNANSLPETAITVGSAADLILALIDKEPQP